VRVILDQVAAELRIKQPSDWYHVKLTDLRRIAPTKLATIERAFGNFHSALAAAFPDHRFEPWRFRRVPSHFWASDSNIRPTLEWVAKMKHIKSAEDWYNLTSKDLVQLGRTLVLLSCWIY